MGLPNVRAAVLRGIYFSVVATLGLAGGAGAAVLSLGTPTFYNAAMPTVNLDGGTVDWAYWTSSTDTAIAAPMAPTNRKSGGTASISALGTLGSDQNVRGSTFRTYARFSYTNGASPASGSVSGVDTSFIFNNTVHDTTQGVTFTLSGDTTQPRTATLYLGGFGATGQLTLTLNGATTIVDTSQVYDSSFPKSIVAYPVTYRPDNASDVLTVKYLPMNLTDINAHVAAQAVTVTPEPTSVAGVASVTMALLSRRRRRERATGRSSFSGTERAMGTQRLTAG